MIMMRTSISLYALLLLCLMAACSKKEQVQTLFLSDQLRQMVPYGNGQVVRFTNGQGTTIEAAVNVKRGTTKKSACATCEAYVYEEFMEVNMTVGGKPFVNMSVDSRPIVFMSIFSPEDNYQIGAGFDFATIEGTSQPSCNAPRQTCFDSLSIGGGMTYNRILEISNGVSNSSSQLTKAYYTVSRGLVGFAYGNGITYRLLQ
jgi:hypothetical protein